MKTDKQEPIAIVGINLKFPGDAVSAESFWKLLCEKRCTVGRVPEDRFNVDSFYHPDPARTDSLKVKHGHFIKEDIKAFDAPFFTMSAAEASILDFQQRGLLEGAYHTFENAGISVEDLAGSNTSVFVASFGRDLDSILLRDPEYQHRYQATCTGSTMLSARISHFFDLRGPSLSVDTACSSGLYAFHLACQSLLSGDSEMSLVAGSNTYVTPECMSIPLCNAGFLSVDGISYSFDHRANGYARGEGFGFALLKPLSHALRDGDMIRAVVRATGVNQDGKTPSITQPSASAQMDLIHKTYSRGGLDLASTAYVEAHGTGTIVGDPIEASAIGEVFREHRDDAHPLLVGSVKSNIGHLEGASGLAGLLKTVLILERGIIPPNVWTEKINPAIDTKRLRIEFPTKPLLWPTNGLRRASVSSFGYGGSNAHIVLDDAFNYLKSREINGLHQSIDLCKSTINGQNGRTVTSDSASSNNHGLLLFSAADEDGPRRQGENLQSYLAALPRGKITPKYFSDLLYTLSDRRTHFPWRSFAVSGNEAPDRLSDALSKSVRASTAAKLHFVFTGQGAQWARMGVGLLRYPVFRQSLEESQAYLKSLGCSWDLLDELQKSPDSTQINRPALAQPICTVIQVALVELFRSWNVSPSSVCGHSSGEIAAAFCAGALTRESALKVAYHRGVVADKLRALQSEATTMMSVGLGENEIAPYLAMEAFSSFVSLGCINSPVNVTLTGTKKHIDRMWEIFDKKEVFVRKLAVDLAYHSKWMQAVAAEYEDLIQDIKGASATKSHGPGYQPAVAIYSSVSGAAVPLERLSQPSYWVENLVSPVRFCDALTEMVTGGQATARVSKQALHMLVEIAKSNDQRSVLEATGKLWACGIEVDVGLLNAASEFANGKPELLADLPGYPFSRANTYWQESRLSRNYAFRPYRRHQLLGLRAKDWNAGEASWRHFIKAQECPWVMDHGLNNSPLYPGSGMIVMAIEAARQLSANFEGEVTGYRLKNMRFLRAININTSEHGTEAQIHLRPRRLASNSTGVAWYDWRIYTLNGDDWAECAYGSIQVETASDGSARADDRKARTVHSLKNRYEEAASRCSHTVHAEQMYDNLAKFGFSYGPYFRQLGTLKYSKTGQASATLPLRGYAEKMRYAGEDPCVIHPTTLDALCHLQMASLSHGGWKQMPTMIFSHLRELWVSQKLLLAGGNPLLTASTTETMRGFREAEYDTIAVLAESQEPVVTIEGERGTAITSLSLSADATTEDKDGIIFGLDFKPDLSLLNEQETCKLLTPLFEAFEAPDKTNIDRADAIALYHVERVLEKLKQSGFTAKKSKTHVQRYISWMERIAKDGKKFTLESRGHKNLVIQDVLRDAHLEPSQHLVAKAGENLYDILTGKTDPLQVIFDGTIAEDFYHSAAFTTGYKKMGAYLDFLAHQNPGMKLLEVGAGTGSSTEQILSFLGHDLGGGQIASRFSEYVYTDISAGFFERARERFQKHARNMKFQKLDLEEDPASQGFTPGTYDVVVAGNVLHATSDLPRTLRYVRSLLKPGGKLLLAEVANMDDIRVALVFGLLPGWWLKAAGDTFDQGPLLTEAQWAEQLPQCGFTGLDMSFRDHKELPYHRLSFLVAAAVDESPVPMPVPAPLCFILRDNISKAQERVAIALQEVLSSTGITVNVISSPLEKLTDLGLDLKESNVISLFELENSVLAAANDKQFQSIRKIGLEPKYIVWVTNGGGLTGRSPDGEIMVGLGRTICSERGDQSLKTLSLDNHHDVAGTVDAIRRVFMRMTSNPGPWDESEYAQRDGVVQMPRVAPQGRLNEAIDSKTGTPALETYTVGQGRKPDFTAAIGTPGLLDTILYREKDDGRTRPLDIGDVEIEVKASSLNFKDLMHALGQIPGHAIGFDGAGVVSRTAPRSSFAVGDRVMWSSADGGALGAFVTCSELQTQKIPEDLSFHAAAGLPVVYNTVIYSLVDLARLRKGESVLIHAGAGGVGQAAIQLAKILGAGDIFVTVGSEAKRQLLKDLYNLPDDRIFSSRDASFGVDIRQATNGRGVDVILNSLGGDLLQASWDVIAPFGRFIEIGKGDIINNSALPMEPFNRNVTFAAVDVSLIHQKSRHMIKRLLEDFMALREKHPELHEPRPLHVFPASKLEDAMRFLQGGKNTGKTIIDYDVAGDEIQFQPALKPAYRFDAEAIFVISGGLGGLGRNIIRWMTARGARYFLALSRRGADNNPEAAGFIKEIMALGAEVWAPACDVTDRVALQSTLYMCSQRYPPVKGCIQAAMALRDCPFEKMTGEIFQHALAPKVLGSQNLHELLPQDMDFFVFLASISGTVGQRGQGNYAAGNTFEDALSRHRISQGMKAVSLNLPVLAEAGWAVDNYNSVTTTLRTGHEPVTQDQLMALLDIVCDPSYDCTKSGAEQLVILNDSPQSLWRMVQEGSVDWMTKPLFANVAGMGQTSQAAGGENGNSESVTVDYLALVKNASGLEEAGDALLQGLVKKLSKALSVPLENLDVSKPAYVLGVDSLIAVEVRYWFVRNLMVEIAVFDILKDQSLVTLCQMVAARVPGASWASG